MRERTGIQQEHADCDGYDSRSVQELFGMEIFLTFLGIQYYIVPAIRHRRETTPNKRGFFGNH